MPSLRVLLVAFHYPPEISAGVQRARIMERFLVERGCDVTLLVPHRLERGLCGSRVLHVPLPRYLRGGPQPPDGAAAARPWSRFRRWVRRWLLVPDVFVGWSWAAAAAALRQARHAPWRLVITSSPPESVHWIGWRLQRALGTPWLADFRDGWTLEPHREEIRLPIRGWFDRQLERCVVRRASWITVNARPVADDFATRVPCAKDRIHVLPTGFLASDAVRPDRDDGMFRLVYTGRFTLSWPEASPEPFFEGLRQALDADRLFAQRFRLVLVGSFTEAERALWQRPPLDAVVEARPPCAYDEAMRWAAGATMLLLVAPQGLRSVIPRKLFDYLAARRPIFAVSGENEVSRMLRETSAGICCPADPGAIARTLLDLFGLWLAGRLDREIPCSGNDRYRAEPHFERVLGGVVLDGLLGSHASPAASGAPQGPLEPPREL